MFDLTIESPIIITIFLLFSGIIIRISLVLAGQYWANTFHHLATYMLLPNIAYIITSTISNNIALSLGMIGALSIVRFRNPVKSPLELVIYFALITIGIGSAVNFKLSIILTIIIITLSFIIKKYEKIYLIILSSIFIVATFISFYHFGIEQGFIKESLVCDLNNQNNNLTKEDLLKELKEKTISCKDVTFKFLGLSLATINTIISMLLSIILIKKILNYEKNKQK